MANVSRSAPRWEGMKLGVDATTPAEALDAVAAAVKSFLNNHASEFTGEHLVAVNFAGDPMKVALCIWTEYAHPGADLGRTARARHELYVAVGAAVQAAGVRYTLPSFEGAPPGGAAGGAAAAAAAGVGGPGLAAGARPWAP